MTDQATTAPQPMQTTRRTFVPSGANAHQPLTGATTPGPSRCRLGTPFVQLDRATRRVAARGELDFAAVPMLADALGTFRDTEAGDITLDLSGVSFIDAGALGCLAGVANKLEAGGARLSVVGASPWLQRVFDIAQLSELLQLPGPHREDRRAMRGHHVKGRARPARTSGEA